MSTSEMGGKTSESGVLESKRGKCIKEIQLSNTADKPSKWRLFNWPLDLTS